MKTRFCLIRHGETDWNAERRVQGQIDIPLNATGEGQALAAGRSLADEMFAAAYSSDLKRALQTAAMLTRAPIEATAELRERHFGTLQSLTMKEAEGRHPDVWRQHVARDVHYDLDGGESMAAFARRVMAALDELAQRHAGQTVLVVTHGGVLDIVYRTATGRALGAKRDFQIPNAAFNWLEKDAAVPSGVQAWRILLWADQRHLGVALDELPG